MTQKTNWDVLVEDVSQSKAYNTILKNKVLFGIGTAMILILAVVLYGMIGGESDAPDFTLKDTGGNTFSLSDYEGEKIVVLDFMFTTCVPCEKFVKDALEPYSKNMDNNDVVIISVSVFGEDDESELRNYAKDFGWIHAMGDSNGDIELAYGVTGTTKLFIIEKNGQITYEAGGTTGKSVPKSSNELELEFV